MGIFPEVWASVRVTLGLVDNSSDDFPNATFLEVKDYIMKKTTFKKTSGDLGDLRVKDLTPRIDSMIIVPKFWMI